ncbi:hypothetical protein BDZ45DRAFT_678981 [Acephala macrosclerotiorum]|nr:hypothetical protein BDZ45DRAFT_678981 [Acephala macrosclerotiorum]
MSRQSPITFSGFFRRELYSREPFQTSPKRNRVPTSSDQNALTLPPYNRSKKRAPPLKPTNAFLFKARIYDLRV